MIKITGNERRIMVPANNQTGSSTRKFQYRIEYNGKNLLERMKGGGRG